MKSFTITLVAVIFLALQFSCSDFTDEYHDVAPELKIHVDAFYAEARKQGFELPKDGLSVLTILTMLLVTATRVRE